MASLFGSLAPVDPTTPELNDLSGKVRPGILSRLGETWPARLAQDVVGGVKTLIDGGYAPGVRREDLTDIPPPSARGVKGMATQPVFGSLAVGVIKQRKDQK
ncbi:MAG: hypothetical protein WC670_19350 [Pseudolabrys sp.]|jgi:hypothetical protein